MKIFSILNGLLPSPVRVSPRVFDPAWIHDPLSHPDIAAMSQRELADLPLSRGRRAAANADACCRAG